MADEKRIKVVFSAVEKSLVESMPKNVTKTISGKDYRIWGEDNHYPDFLYEVSRDSSTLQSVVNGIVDYVIGNGIECSERPNDKESWEELLIKIVSDYVIYGICYFNVRKRNDGSRFVEWLDARKTRMNEFCDVFFYSEDWSKSYGRVQCVVLPKWTPDSEEDSSVICVKTPLSRDTYPTPIWQSAIKAALMECKIDDFHINDIENQFNVSAIINFNNGIPSDEEKADIERNISEKFCGSENAGRYLLSFNDNKDNATTLERLDSDNFEDRYFSLADNVRMKIFTAFRANPNLFGIPTENIGFSREEYDSTFKLFNRTMIAPIQKRICGALESVGYDIRITPFTLE